MIRRVLLVNIRKRRELALCILFVLVNATVLVVGQPRPTKSKFPSVLLLEHQGSVLVHSETVVSGVDIRNDNLEQVLRKLGPPDRVKMSSLAEWEQEFVTTTYEWDTTTSRVRIKTQNVVGLRPKIREVEAWGTNPAGDMGTTGRGLKLGDSIKDARRIYELRQHFGITLSDNVRCGDYAEYPPTLVLDFDQNNRLNHLAFTLNTPCISY